jgi:DNA-binding NtrC family response regulator
MLREVVRRHIMNVLEEVGGNKRRAARELGVSRATLDRRLAEIARRKSR